MCCGINYVEEVGEEEEEKMHLTHGPIVTNVGCPSMC